MLKNIVDVLFYGSLAARVDNKDTMITMLAETDAKEVLDLMEKLGMLPPHVTEQVKTSVVVAHPMGYQELIVEDSKAYISRWEPENET